MNKGYFTTRTMVPQSGLLMEMARESIELLLRVVLQFQYHGRSLLYMKCSAAYASLPCSQTTLDTQIPMRWERRVGSCHCSASSPDRKSVRLQCSCNLFPNIFALQFVESTVVELTSLSD